MSQLSREMKNWQLDDDLYYCVSELHDRTYSLPSHACESHNFIKMLALSVLER